MSTIVGYLIGQVGEFSGARFAIPEQGLVVGRDPKHADLVIEHSLVSRRHAQIARAANNTLVLTDLESRNGTFLNGHRLDKPVSLQLGDKIDFGGPGGAVFQFDTAEGAPLTGVLAQIFGEAAAPVEWQPGDTILDLYKVKKVLGQGGMGKVYLVHHRSWNMDLAVKSPLPKIFENEEGKANFIREAETWVNLNLHPNICQCHYVRTIGGIPRIFAEYVPGGTLHHWIAQKKLAQLDQILDVVIQLAWGLHAAHEQGVVHQDVKPGNVLMTMDGMPKVSDFGLARAREVAGESTEAGQNLLVSVGGMTPAYCSPEQASGKKLTPKSDMWSWALSVLQIFTGEVVWRFGVEAPEVLAKYQRFLGPGFVAPMPKRLKKLLFDCFHLRPEDRPKNMLDVATELQAIYQQDHGKSYPHSEPKALEHLADNLNNRAVSLLDLGKPVQAEEVFGQALRAQPSHLQASYNLGTLRWRNGAMTDEEVLSDLEQVRLSQQQDWVVLYLIGMVHLERGDSENALSLFEQAKRLGGEDELGWALDKAHSPSSRIPQSIRRFSSSQLKVTSIALDAGGNRALSVAEKNSLRLWDVATEQCLGRFGQHAVTVTSVALSQDGCLAASGSEDGAVRLWDIRTGRLLKTLQGHGKEVTSVALSPDCGWVLSGSNDRTIRLWKVAGGQCVRKFAEDCGVSAALSWERQIAISCESVTGSMMAHNEALRIWDLNTGRCVKAFGANVIPLPPIALSADGCWALSSSLESGLCLWHVGSGHCCRTFKTRVSSLALSADGERALIYSQDELSLWHFGIKSWVGQAPTAPAAICRSVRTEEAASASERFVKVMKQAESAFASEQYALCARMIQQARSVPGFIQDRTALDLDQRAALHSIRRGLRGAWCQRVLRTETPLESIAISPEGGKAIAAGFQIQTWDVTQQRIVHTFEEKTPGSNVRAVALSQDGRQVLTGGEQQSLVLWDANTGRRVKSFTGHKGDVWGTALTADGKWVLSAAEDKTLRFWESSTGRCCRTLEAHTKGVRSIAISADTRLVLSGGEDQVLRLWELATGRCLRTFNGHKGGIRSVVFGADGRRALSGAKDGALRLWDIATGQCLRAFEGHTSVVASVALSVDGRFAVSGSWDHTVRLWDVATGHCARILEGHRDEVHAVVISKDGRWVFSGSWDETVRVWELDWESEFPETTDWDEGTRPYLQAFLILHTSYAASLPNEREPTEKEIELALSRDGKPTWTESDFNELLYTLGCAGYGWLRPEGVRRELVKMASTWDKPPPLW